MEYSDHYQADIFSVVGFVFREKMMLVIFPKHYYENSIIEELNTKNEEADDDIRLLFDVIKKYSETEKSKASARSYLGPNESYDAEYPFASFFEIYDYFRKYGLYKEEKTIVKPGYSGKISWKTTISKSNKVVSGNNLIFLPLYVTQNKRNQVFVSECMAFVIDYTIDYFHSFMNLKKTGVKSSKFDYLSNKEYVISKLHEAKSNVFKDIHKRLIQNLIDFFKQLNGAAIGGKVHVKIRHFNMIWQKMIGNYLNKHFVGMSSTNDSVVFDPSIKKSSVPFTASSFRDIDDSHNGFSIDIDHIAYVNDILYIFDSKYYQNLNELNYKQYSYGEILRYHYPQMTHMHNVLLLPGREHSDLHFSLSSGYIGKRMTGCTIIEQYLEPKIVMMDYLED